MRSFGIVARKIYMISVLHYESEKRPRSLFCREGERTMPRPLLLRKNLEEEGRKRHGAPPCAL
jgi:hypothetical protein